MTLEAGFIQFDRMAIKQGFVALAALRLVAGPLRRHTVGGAAMRANDMKRVAHAEFRLGSLLLSHAMNMVLD